MVAASPGFKYKVSSVAVPSGPVAVIVALAGGGGGEGMPTLLPVALKVVQ